MLKRLMNWPPALAVVACVLVFAPAVIIGCANEDASKVPDSTPAVGSAVDQSESHVKSADALIVRAKPEANKTGQALIDAASGEHGEAVKQLEVAKKELVKVSDERTQLGKINKDQADRITKDENTWGYKLGQFVNKIIWGIVAFIALHYILAILTGFISGPIGIVVGFAAKWTDVFGWLGKLSLVNWKAKTPCPEYMPTAYGPVPIPAP